MDLLKALKMSLLNFSFIMIYTVQKLLVLIKSRLNDLKDNISEWFFKEYGILLIFLKNWFFSKYILMESLSLEEENIIKDIRNLFILKKDISKLRQKKKQKLKQLKTEY